MNADQQLELQQHVRSIFQHSIEQLVAIGMQRDEALMLLLIQSANQMPESEAIIGAVRGVLEKREQVSGYH